MWKHGCGLDAAMAYYRARDTEAAVREIMRIIGER